MSAALTVAVLWEIGATVQRLVAHRSAAAAMAATSPKHTRRTRPRDAFDIQGLVKCIYLGSPGLAQDTVAAETREPLFLHGTLATAEPDKGLAIVGTAETSGILYHVGADMPGGLQLHQVFADHIVMARGGALESLYLPKSTLAAEPASDRPPSAAATPAVPSGGAILRICETCAPLRAAAGACACMGRMPLRLPPLALRPATLSMRSTACPWTNRIPRAVRSISHKKYPRASPCR